MIPVLRDLGLSALRITMGAMDASGECRDIPIEEVTCLVELFRGYILDSMGFDMGVEMGSDMGFHWV